jgi:predicted nucleic acid-binding protein
MSHIWDTNTAIYYLQRQFPPKAEEFMDGVLLSGPPVISAITEIELLCWKTADEKDEAILREFIDDSVVIELNREVKLETARIRKAHRIKLPDAIIAASAIVFKYRLITRNIRDFKVIPGLDTLNPWDL